MNYFKYKSLKEYFIRNCLKLLNHLINQFDIRILRFFKDLVLGINAKVIFVVEKQNWAIEWVGKNITSNLKESGLLNAEIASPRAFKNKIIHFGSINCLINKKGMVSLKANNKIILTWFHIDPTDYRIKFLPLIEKKVDLLHTSNEITTNKLIDFGFSSQKIVIIPLGIDLNQFRRYNNDLKRDIRKKFNLPKDKIIIGSFQKDGVGWGEGLIPKYVKGPDIFCNVLSKLKEHFDIHVFLTGPARGFVKNRLEELNIQYTYVFLEDFFEIVDAYNTLDLYIITSRAEGGPKALLEAMATGVPIVSTDVGMASSIIKNGYNGFITPVDDVNRLYNFSKNVLEDERLKEKLINNGLKVIKNYSWKEIVNLYYSNLYKQLLN